MKHKKKKEASIQASVLVTSVTNQTRYLIVNQSFEVSVMTL